MKRSPRAGDISRLAGYTAACMLHGSAVSKADQFTQLMLISRLERTFRFRPFADAGAGFTYRQVTVGSGTAASGSAPAKARSPLRILASDQRPRWTLTKALSAPQSGRWFS